MLAAALLENDDRGPTGLLFDLAHDGCTRYQGRTDIHRAAIGNHKHIGKADAVACGAFKLFDEDLVIGCNAILLAASLYHCVHFITFFIPRALWRRCKLMKQRALMLDITSFCRVA